MVLLFVWPAHFLDVFAAYTGGCAMRRRLGAHCHTHGRSLSGASGAKPPMSPGGSKKISAMSACAQRTCAHAGIIQEG